MSSAMTFEKDFAIRMLQSHECWINSLQLFIEVNICENNPLVLTTSLFFKVLLRAVTNMNVCCYHLILYPTSFLSLQHPF